MIRTALTMLVCDRVKSFGIVLGRAFASPLMTQQGGIFRGIMVLVYGHVSDTRQAQLWISDPGITEIDTNDRINGRDLAVAGICRWSLTLMLYPTAYMLRSHLSMIDLGIDRAFNFILVGTDAQADARPDLSFRLEPILLLISFAAVLVISLADALVSLRLDPALAFRS